MLRDAIVALIAQHCGNRDDLDTKIIAEMDYVQTIELEQSGNSLPWFIMTEDATASTTANEPRLPVPTDFLIEIDDQMLEVYNSDTGRYQEIRKGTQDELAELYAEEATGLPKRYSLSGHYFRFFPTPDAAYTIRMRYMASQALPSSGNIENPWMKYASDLIMAKVGMRVAGLHLKDFDTATLFKAMETAAVARLLKLQTAREEANRTRSMGDD